jgi:hypothetical protein
MQGGAWQRVQLPLTLGKFQCSHTLTTQQEANRTAPERCYGGAELQLEGQNHY